MLGEPTLLGTVEAVVGSKVTIVLNDAAAYGLAFVGGVGYRVGQIGSFVRIPLGYQDLFGIVVSAGSTAAVETNTRENDAEDEANRFRGRRSLMVELAGEGDRSGDFRRGVSQFPTIGDEAHIVTESDLARIYGRPNDGRYVRIGSVASAESIPALIELNKLLTRHSAILGSTGSGKSTTVATVLAAISDKTRYPSARIIVLDIHGEYAKAFKGLASVFRVDADEEAGERKLFVPYWALNFDEILTLAFGEFANDADRGVVRQKIEDRKRQIFSAKKHRGVTEENLTVDTPIPFSIHDLWFELHKLVYSTFTVQGTNQSEENVAYVVKEGKPVEKGDAMRVQAPRYKGHTLAAGGEKIYQAANSLNIRRQVDGLAAKLRDPRFDFLFRPGRWTPNPKGEVASDLDDLMKGWLGGDTPIVVLDLSGIPSSVLEVLVGALLRVVFDCLFWARNVSEGGRLRPLLIVMEEAHAYLGPSSASDRAKHAAGRIVKEGRKYGLGAMIVSQRPSEIDPTILSQCGTIVALRLTNPSDRAMVAGTVSDNLEGLLATLPTLRTGEAIVVGEAVQLPMRALVSPPPINRRPDSSDPEVYTSDEVPGGWNSPLPPADYEDVIALWRRQDYRSEKLLKVTSGKKK